MEMVSLGRSPGDAVGASRPAAAAAVPCAVVATAAGAFLRRCRASRFGRSPRHRIVLAGALLCVVAASGTLAIVGSIPGMPAAGATDPAAPLPGLAAAAAAGNADPEPESRPSPAAQEREGWRRCPECGVVKSIRVIAGSPAPSASAPVRGRSNAGPETRRRYEITVRFRDGATTILNEASPRDWQVGNHVIVIAGANPRR
jgi:hypothetical protein